MNELEFMHAAGITSIFIRANGSKVHGARRSVAGNLEPILGSPTYPLKRCWAQATHAISSQGKYFAMLL